MSKDKSLDTTLVKDGVVTKKHNIPREMLSIIERVCELDFIESIGSLRYRQSKKSPKREIKNFLESTNSYFVEIVGEKYEQKFYFKLKQNGRRVIHEYYAPQIIRAMHGV